MKATTHRETVPCRGTGKGKPRLLPTHQADCDFASCRGCLPCPERHCRTCGRQHVTLDGRGNDHTCVHCLAETRAHLHGVRDEATRIFGEALRRGINSEATMLAGPTADVEAWAYRKASALAGRIDPRWLNDNPDELHPLWVLGTWERAARRHLGQVLSPGSAQPTLTEAHDYLDLHLARLAHLPEFPFPDLAEAVAHCHTHLEDVLYDGERDERGAPCPSCGAPHLVKDYAVAETTGRHRCRACGTEGTDPDASHCPDPWCWTPLQPEEILTSSEADDRWTCPRCHQWWTDKDYRSKVQGVYVSVAPALTGSQIRETYRVPEGTVRSWAERGKVAKRGRDAHGRMLYDVDQVLAARDEQEAREKAAQEAREQAARAKTKPAEADQ